MPEKHSASWMESDVCIAEIVSADTSCSNTGFVSVCVVRKLVVDACNGVTVIV